MKNLLFALFAICIIPAANADKLGQQILSPGTVIQTVGTSSATTMFVPNFDEAATCFEGLSVVNVDTGEVIGSATDCMSDMVTDADDNITLTATTFFDFPSGEVVVQGVVDMTPLTTQAITNEGMPATHMTGSAAQGNSILEGADLFKHGTANSRIQGMVNMDLFDDGVMQFSCFFILTDIDLDK